MGDEHALAPGRRSGDRRRVGGQPVLFDHVDVVAVPVIPEVRPMHGPDLTARLAAGLLVVALAGSGCSTDPSPGDAGRSGSSGPGGTGASTAAVGAPTGDLFQRDKIHDVSVTFDDAAYGAMVEVYGESQKKEWIEATVVIDGTTFERAGMRLKGNSSLFGLRDADPTDPMSALPFRPGGSANAEEPESLPWLVSLDKFVDGASYGGMTEFVVRSSQSESALEEVVALDLLEEIDMPTQRAAYLSFAVNGRRPALRLAVENPNDAWDAAAFPEPGYLYKSEASANWTYRGDDPKAYKDVFDQETRTDDDNLVPLIEFLDFVNNSDDATFLAELPDRLDVEAFVKYLAFEDLIGNFDDIDGPGNNSYLRYTESTDTFTVVAWDHNLAFGGFQRMIRQGLEGAGTSTTTTEPTTPSSTTRPTATGEGATPPGIPEIGQNPLVNRFKADPQSLLRYELILAQLRQKLFTDGVARRIVDSWSNLLTDQAAALVDVEVLRAETAELQAFIAG